MTIIENGPSALEVADAARWFDHDGVTSSVNDNVTLTRPDGAQFWLSDDRWAGSASWSRS